MRKAMKWIALGLGVVCSVLLLGVLAVFLIGRATLQRTYALESPLQQVPHDALSVARGEHIAQVHGCAFCHGDGLGGQVFLDIPPGLIVAPNLTAGEGGVGTRYNGRDWDRAVRLGLRHDDHSLLPFMPFAVYGHLHDDDAAALAAYLDQLPAVDHRLPATIIRPIGYAMLAFGNSDQARADPNHTRAAEAVAATASYGAYLASTVCAECHGADLRGGTHPAPQAPPVPGLMQTGTWSLAEFSAAVRTGIAPNGRALSQWMPAKQYLHHLDDIEIAALHAYVQQEAAKARKAVSALP